MRQLRSRASWQALCYSRDGWLAAVSDKGRLSIWNPDERRTANRSTPLKARKRRDRPTLNRSVASVSWSADTEAVACFDAEAVWTHQPSTGTTRTWMLPAARQAGTVSSAGACFLGETHDVLVHGHRVFSIGSHSFIAVLRGPDLDADSVIESGSERPGSIAGETGASDAGTPFSDVHHALPNPTGDQIAVAGTHGQVGLYELPSWQLVKTAGWFPAVRAEQPVVVDAVSFSPDGRYLAAFASGERLLIGDASTLKLRYESPKRLGSAALSRFSHHTPRIAWSPDGSTLAVNHVPGEIELYGL